MPVIPDNLKEEQLDEVLASYLKAAQLGQAPNREKLLEQHPELRPALSQFFRDHELMNRVTTPLRSALAADDTGKPGQMIGGYELLGKIAQGGMGVVWRALQKNLNRVVALKTLRAGPQASAPDRRRFRAEAEAVARLEHPHIVPIYEVGEQDGELYFSMKLFEGGSLAQAKARFAGDPRATAKVMATVASAVHYAHQRGILHRDLKPGNILLDDQGEPHVGDFGLAKRIPGSAGAPEGSGITQSGAILGTPSYMAPEQATGKTEAVTTAVDIYSLGAILYELQTGRPPFKGETLLETLCDLLEREPVPPRTLNPRADRDLETICLKCLEKQPGRRYPTAQALADDLQRFLAGEPIEARPLTTVQRLGRWCRRQPVLAGMSAALLLSFITGFVLVAWQWRRAEGHAQKAQDNFVQATKQRLEAESQSQRAERNAVAADEARREAEKQQQRAEANARLAQQERVDAEKQKQRAEENFRLAHEAVNDLSTRLTEAMQNLEEMPGRKEVLEQARKYYQTFLKQSADNPALQRDLADVSVRLASISRATGSKGDALAAERTALDLYEKLHAAKSDDPALQQKLADAMLHVGLSYHEVGQEDASMATYRQARALFEKFLQQRPDDPKLLSGLSKVFHNLGVRTVYDLRPAEGLGYFQEALKYHEKLVGFKPNDAFVLNGLAGIHSGVAHCLSDQGQFKEAVVALEKAEAIREKLVQQHPQVAQFQRDLGEVQYNKAVQYRKLGRPAEALAADERAHALYDKLVQDHPGITQFQRDLAGSEIKLGEARRNAGRTDEALTCFQNARALQDRLVKKNPGVPAYRKELSGSWFQIGLTYAGMGNKAEALLAYQKSRELMDKLVEADPRNISYRVAMGATLNNLGVVLGQRDQIDEAIAVGRLAVEHSRYAFDKAPQVEFHRRALNNSYGSFGESLRFAGKLSEAAATVEERVKLYPNDAPELFRTARDFGLLANRVGRGKAEPSPAEQKQRNECVQRAFDTLRRAIERGYQDRAKLEKEAAFELLRPRDEFQKLLASIKPKETPEK
jgi:serine/threonine-protein kinase